MNYTNEWWLNCIWGGVVGCGWSTIICGNWWQFRKRIFFWGSRRLYLILQILFDKNMFLWRLFITLGFSWLRSWCMYFIVTVVYVFCKIGFFISRSSQFFLSWVTVCEFTKLRKKLNVQYIVFYFTFIFPARKVEKVLNIAKRLNYMT